MHILLCYESLSSNDMLSLIIIGFIISFHLRVFVSAIKSFACAFTHNYTKICYVLITFFVQEGRRIQPFSASAI